MTESQAQHRRPDTGSVAASGEFVRATGDESYNAVLRSREPAWA